MKFIDAVLALALAAHIHGTDKAVVKTAGIVVKKVAARHRQIIDGVIKAPAPRAMVIRILVTMPDWMITPGAEQPAA